MLLGTKTFKGKRYKYKVQEIVKICNFKLELELSI